MTLPDWQSFSGGSMKRAALWLAAAVGEGGVFTKEELRLAFPGVGQIDRRVRDLRDDGWIIHTNREDVSLGLEEQRLVAIGGRVWERDYRRRGEPSLSGRERQEIFAEDHYTCLMCGISGGEPYPDAPLLRAKLTVGRLEGPGGRRRVATLCDRCHRGDPKLPEAEEVRAGVRDLGEADRGRFIEWMQAERRRPSAVEALWAAYCRMPAADRREIRDGLVG